MNRPRRTKREEAPRPRSKTPQMSVSSTSSRVTKHNSTRTNRTNPAAPQQKKSMRVPITKPTRQRPSNARPSSSTQPVSKTDGPTDSAGHLISNLQQQVSQTIALDKKCSSQNKFIFPTIFKRVQTVSSSNTYIFIPPHHHFAPAPKIYFLEMETQYLRSNLGDGTIPPQATVDDQMRALTRAFRETEAKYKVEAEETAKDLLRLTGELNKRDKAYTQLKQFCEEQEVLKDTMKAQQQAELQRGHERRVEALKLVDTTQVRSKIRCEKRKEKRRAHSAHSPPFLPHTPPSFLLLSLCRPAKTKSWKSWKKLKFKTLP